MSSNIQLLWNKNQKQNNMTFCKTLNGLYSDLHKIHKQFTDLSSYNYDILGI